MAPEVRRLVSISSDSYELILSDYQERVMYCSIGTVTVNIIRPSRKGSVLQY